MTFLYFNCKRTNLDQILTIKVITGSIEDKSLKMTLGPYGLNIKDMVTDLNKLIESLPEGLEVYMYVYLFKDLSFILIPKGISITTLCFLVYSKKGIKSLENCNSPGELFYYQRKDFFGLKSDLKKGLKAILVVMKLKLFFEQELFKKIDISPKNGEIVNLTKKAFKKNDLKSLLGTLKSFS